MGSVDMGSSSETSRSRSESESWGESGGSVGRYEGEEDMPQCSGLAQLFKGRVAEMSTCCVVES